MKQVPQLKDELKSNDVGPAWYLVEWLFDIGPLVAGSPITYSEIESWSRVKNIEITPWEAHMMKRLSRAYEDQSIKSRSKTCPSPYLSEEKLTADKDKFQSQFDAIFSSVNKEGKT